MGFPRTASSIAFTAALLCAPQGMRSDWLTWGHDTERSGWTAEESKLSPDKASDLQLQWSAPLDNKFSQLNALTAPLVARNVATASGNKSLVYVAGSSNQMFAVDSETGKTIWQKMLPSFVRPKAEPMFLCPNVLNATPVIDRRQNLIFVVGVDGRLFGMDLGTGDIHFGPFPFVPPFVKAWSLNLKNGWVYTTTSQNCAGDHAGIYAMQISNPTQSLVRETVIRNGGGAGMWNRGGTAISPEGTLFVSTGDGAFDPANHDYGSTYLAASLPDLTVRDYYSPQNWNEINKKDLDLPSGGMLWFAHHNYHLIVGGGKESSLYLLNADELGSKDHGTALYITPQLGNPGKSLQQSGLWGSPAFWKDDTGQPWIYVPLWGPPTKGATAGATTNGDAPHGSIVAFKVESQGEGQAPCLKAAWISPDINLPDAPAVANGVLFILATGENSRQTNNRNDADWKKNLTTTEERNANTHPAELIALDAKTGKLLYRSQDAMKTWAHFGGLAIDDGKVYAVDHSSTLYSFSLKAH